MLTNRFLVIIAAACVPLLVSCSNNARRTRVKSHEDKLQVVATIFVLSDWARQVGGDRVQVTTLLPAGSSPHTFDPAPRDISKVHEADAFLLVGLRMDTWGARLLPKSNDRPAILSLGDVLAEKQQLPALDSVLSGTEVVTANTDEHEGHDHTGHDHHDHDHSGVNPHFWLDPQLAILCAEDIAALFTRLDPAGAESYTSNTLAFTTKLRTLDNSLSQQLEPCRGKAFISFHDAYPYFARRYGLTIAAVIEEYPGKTPSDRYIKRVAQQLRTLGLKTLFIEPQLNRRAADVIAQEVGATVDLLDPYGTESAPDRNSYIKLLEFNAAKLQKALCSPATTNGSNP